jgi:hypothetical protein
MNSITRSFKPCLAALLLAGATFNTSAVTYTVDPGASWLGFMNVFELPANGGGYAFGSPWGTADLRASFSGSTLTLAPNTINDPAPYWYIGGGGPGAPGNKIMDASFYQEFTGPLAGQTVTFTGNVLANSLTSAHSSVAFIKEFSAGYALLNSTTVPLVNGVFSISLATINDPANHVQFGFETIGVNVWATDVGPFGQVDITAVPEPSCAALLIAGISGLAFAARRKGNSLRHG